MVVRRSLGELGAQSAKPQSLGKPEAQPEDVFRELFFKYGKRVAGYFRARGFDDPTAADLTQETFLGLYKGLSKYREEGSEAEETAWLFQIAKNICANHLRSRKADKRTATDIIPLDSTVTEVAEKSPGPLSELLTGERSALLAAGIAELPARMRKVVLLYLDGMSYSDIASMLLVSEETVRAHLFQARLRLRTILSDLDSNKS